MIIIIDGLNYIYRASSFNNGEYSIIYRFFRALRATVEQFNTDKCFFILDGYSKFRRELSSSYKANRIIKYSAKVVDKAQNISFNIQKNEIIRLLEYLPIQIIKSNNYEADDVIAKLCDDLKTEDICIVSNDSDYIQLIQKHNNVKVYDPIKKIFMESPAQYFLLYRILVGDVSDNVKRLVSDKDAIELCETPTKLKSFLSNDENRAEFNINRQLIEFQTVSDAELKFYDYNIDFDYLKSEFNRMGFKRIVQIKYWSKFIETFSKLR